MSTRREVCQGIDPIPAFYDIGRDTFAFISTGGLYEWGTADLPFTIYRLNNRNYADRELVERYGKAKK